MKRTSVIMMALLAACQVAMPRGTFRTSGRSESADSAAAGSSSSSSAYSASQPLTSEHPAAPATPPAIGRAPDPAPARTGDAANQPASDDWHAEVARKRAAQDGQVIAPSVVGMTLEQATVAFQKAGFTTPVQATFQLQCQQSRHQMNRVDCQDPVAGIGQYANTQPRVQIWDGRVIRYVSPDEANQVVGMTVDAAQAKLHTMGLGAKCRVMEQPSDASCADGRVCTVIVRSHECTLVVNQAYEIAGPK